MRRERRLPENRRGDGNEAVNSTVYDAFNCNGDGVSASISGIWNISMKGEKEWDTMRR